MPQNQGSFVWYDLMTSDQKAAEAFYKAVVGWDMADSGMPDRSYTIISQGKNQIGGLMPIPKEACDRGAKPMWTGYIGVADVDAAVNELKKKGGTVKRPPEDIPGVGRFSVVADPGGATFNLFTSKDGEPPKNSSMAPGQVGWRELNAADGPKAYDFYSQMFGWTKTEAMDMGNLGVYQLFAAGGKDAVGGIMTKMAAMPMPMLLFYFVVGNIDAAVERVKKAGGQVINGPMEVPGGAWIIQGIDPQGAMFALVGDRK
jgi:predicted enzyme related to lactoylglutathione lyase